MLFRTRIRLSMVAAIAATFLVTGLAAAAVDGGANPVGTRGPRNCEPLIGEC